MCLENVIFLNHIWFNVSREHFFFFLKKMCQQEKEESEELQGMAHAIAFLSSLKEFFPPVDSGTEWRRMRGWCLCHAFST